MTYLPLYAGQTDAANLAAAMLVDFHARTGIPAREGNVETALIETIAKAHADTRMIVADQADQAMIAMARLVGIRRIPATPAVATISISGRVGTMVPAGVQMVDAANQVWELVQSVTLTEATMSGQIVAAHPGQLAEPDVRELNLVGQVVGVDTVFLTRLVADGTDEESVGAYLDRAVRELQIMSIVPRLPEEYERVVMRHAHVVKARAVNLMDQDGQTGQPGHLTVFVANATGSPIDTQILGEISQLVNTTTTRPLGVKVHVRDVPRVPLDLRVRLIPENSPDIEAVEAEVNARLTAFFDPARWDWATRRVTIYDFAHLISTTPGVERIEALQFVQEDPAITDHVELARYDRPVVFPSVTVSFDSGPLHG